MTYSIPWIFAYADQIIFWFWIIVAVTGGMIVGRCAK